MVRLSGARPQRRSSTDGGPDGADGGLDDRNALLLTDLNWQLQNGLTYFGQDVRPEVRHTWLPEVLLYAPALDTRQPAVGREIVTTERAAGQLAAAYGPLFSD